MKPNKLILVVFHFLFLVSIVSLSSCKDDPVRGCTNPSSENFNADADEDDGSCILFREKFLGQYNVSESCPSGNYTFVINVVASSSSDDGIIINNLGDFGTAINGTVNESSVTIPNQNITANGVAVSIDGSGSISGNILIINYTYNFSGGGETCSMNCTKQ